ncbi:MAG: PadR family transcriptional regulator [Gammaproteobacteria bacterium]|jgi:PadR family transcriptional regulator, regulatory protein AphA
MQLKTLCLGLLEISDATGYDIKQMFERALNHFHAASYGSIYPSLKQLEEEGHVRSRIETGGPHPGKRLFTLTEQGHEHFIKSLSETEPDETIRSEFLVLMFFSHLLETPVLQEKLEHMEQYYDSKLTMLESLLDQEHSAGIRFTIEFGINALSAKRDFIRKHREEILREHKESPDCGSRQKLPVEKHL